MKSILRMTCLPLKFTKKVLLAGLLISHFSEVAFAAPCDMTLSGTKTLTQLRSAVLTVTDRNSDTLRTICFDGVTASIPTQSLEITKSNLRFEGIGAKRSVFVVDAPYGLIAQKAENFSIHNLDFDLKENSTGVFTNNAKNFGATNLNISLEDHSVGLELVQETSSTGISDIKFSVPKGAYAGFGIIVMEKSTSPFISRIELDIDTSVSTGRGFLGQSLVSVTVDAIVDKISDIYVESADNAVFIGWGGYVGTVQGVYGHFVRSNLVYLFENGRAGLIDDLEISNDGIDGYSAAAVTFSLYSTADKVSRARASSLGEYGGALVELFTGSYLGELTQSRLDMPTGGDSSAGVNISYRSSIGKITDLTVRSGCTGGASGIVLNDNSRVGELRDFKYFAHNVDAMGYFHAIEMKGNSSIDLISGFSMRADFSDLYQMPLSLIYFWENGSIGKLENGTIFSSTGKEPINFPNLILSSSGVKFKTVPNGDATNDGKIDLQDLNAVRNNQGVVSCYNQIDVTRDGKINLEDLALVRSRMQ